MKKIYITRQIPEVGIKMLQDKGYEADISKEDRPLTKSELVEALKKKPYDGVLCLLTDTIDKEVFDAVPTAKIFANYAIGFNNIDVEEAKKRGIFVSNTPGGGADRVAEHAWALILALTCKVVEGDKYLRAGEFKGWDPMIFHGEKVAGKTLGIIGTGRIGSAVAHKAIYGFGMKISYYDVVRNEKLEQDSNAVFHSSIEEVLQASDIISIHVPLLPTTHHLINEKRLKMMKPHAFLINTSRGPVIDENALVKALQNKQIAGAGLDVFEFEPELAPGLAELSSVVITPHIASATEDARHDMAVMSASNIIAVMEGQNPLNQVS